MYYLFLVLLVLDALLLAGVVLLQAGQGGGLASLGGGTTDLVVGGRQAANLLTKLSWWCGGLFLFFSLILSILAANQGAGVSEVGRRLRETTPPPAAVPLPITGDSAAPAAPGGSTLPIEAVPAQKPESAGTR